MWRDWGRRVQRVGSEGGKWKLAGGGGGGKTSWARRSLNNWVVGSAGGRGREDVISDDFLLRSALPVFASPSQPSCHFFASPPPFLCPL